MKKRRNHNVFWIILLSVLLLVGGSGVAVLIYLDSRGLLSVILDSMFAYISDGANRALIMFWGIVLPVILLSFFVFMLVRKHRVDKFKLRYDDALEQAIEAERKDFVARQNYASSGRFAPMSKGGGYVADGKEVNSLDELCKLFRNFAAAKLKLYFSEQDVREFVASMGTSHILILQGISGAGKTSLAYAFGEFIGNSSTIIPVQPMWKERADLLGYYNEFTHHFNETTLFRKLYEANFGNRIYVTVLDEMNIARIEYYFAEFLSLLELPNPELRNLEVTSDVWDNDPVGINDGCIRLPQNMWFVGTVNNDDSAYVISDKVYDRAMIVSLSGKAKPFQTEEEPQPVSMGFEQFENMVQLACKNYTLSKENQKNMAALDEWLIQKFQLTFGNRIRRQIGDYVAVYVACGGFETEALDDIIAKKVLRKLEYKDVSRFNSEIGQLKQFLDSAFGVDAMVQCKRYLDGVRTE